MHGGFCKVAIGVLICASGFSQTPAPLALTTQAIVVGLSGNTYGLVPAAGGFNLPLRPRYVAAGGRSPYSITMVAGALPPGLSIAAATGFVEGIPTTTGTYTFSVQVTDAANARVRLDNQRIEVAPMPEATLTGAAVGNTFRTTTQCAAGATYTLTGGLGGVLSINGSTGLIRGTPSSTGIFSGVWSCLNPANGLRLSTQFTMNVAPMPSVGIRPGTIGVRFVGSPQFVAAHVPPFTYSIVSGTLTPGLVHQGADSNQISGTPTSPGIFAWVFRRTDSRGDWNTVEFFQSVAKGQGGFQLTPAVLSFLVIEGQSAPVTKSLAVRGNPAGLVFTSTVAASAASWLSLSPNGGALPASLEVSATAADLRPGDYETEIVFAPATGQPVVDSVRFPVRLSVQASPTPVLSFNFPSMAFQTRSDSPPSSLRGQVTNTGGGIADLLFGLSSTKQGDSLKWLRITASKIKLGAGESATINVTVDPAVLAGSGGASLRINAAATQSSAGGQGTAAKFLASGTQRQASGGEDSFHLPITAVSNVCPQMDITPRYLSWRVVPGPKGVKQLGTALVKLEGGTMPKRWSIRDAYENPVGIKLLSESSGTDTSVLIFEVDGSKFSNDDVFFNPIDAVYLVQGPCQNMLFSASAMVAEKTFPKLATNFVVLEPRKPSQKTAFGELPTIHNGPGDFLQYIDLYSAKSSNTPNNTPWIQISSNTNTIYGSDSRYYEEAKTVPPVRIFQYDVVPGPSSYLHEYVSTFTRDDGQTDAQWFKVMQYVGSETLPLPVFPQLPLNPSPTPDLFSTAPVPPRVEDGDPCQSQPALVAPILPRDFALFAGRPAALEALVLSGCGEVMRKGSLGVTFSSGERAVALRSRSDGLWTGDWSPGLADEALTVKFRFEDETRSGEASVLGSVKDVVGQPKLAARPLLGGASVEEQGMIAPGGLYRLRGEGFAPKPVEGAEAAEPLAEKLSLTLNGEPATVLAVTSSEVSFLAPARIEKDLPVTLTLIREKRPTSLEGILGVSAAPSLFSEDGSGAGQGNVYLVGESGRELAKGESAAAGGATLELEATGLGVVDEEGKVKAALQVLIGEGETVVEAIVQGARAVAERPGVYVVRFEMPQGIAASPTTGLVLVADGNRSAPVSFATK